MMGKIKCAGSSGDENGCAYGVTTVKLYTIAVIWFKYFFDLYICYWRHFPYLSLATSVPNELKPFYTVSAFEESKVQMMFRILVNLENRYRTALHLTVIYVANVYCTFWWISSRLVCNSVSRVVLFQVFLKIFNTSSSDFVHGVYNVCTNNINEAACRICGLIKNFMCDSLQSMTNMKFAEELILALALAVMTTPTCIILFLLYRIYRSFLLPQFYEEAMARYVKMDEGPLYNSIRKLVRKMNFNVENFYVSNEKKKEHSAKVVSVRGNVQLVLGWKLVEGHVIVGGKRAKDEPKVTTGYSVGEVNAVVVRAIAEYSIAEPSFELILEITRWVSTLAFAFLLGYGFFGGSRLGFKPSPPHFIAYIVSKHVAIPVFIVVQAVRNNLYRKRCLSLDAKVLEIGLGEEMLTYIGKEARNTNRCPIEEPTYTIFYSNTPPTLDRIVSLRSKMTNTR